MQILLPAPYMLGFVLTAVPNRRGQDPLSPASARPGVAASSTAQPGTTASYVVHAPLRVSITLYWHGGTSGAFVTWGRKHERRTQHLIAPFGWTVQTDAWAAFLPRVVAWRGLSEPTILLVLERPWGVYGVRTPLVLTLHRNQWRLVNHWIRRQEFTDRGSFDLVGRYMLVWDYAADERFAHTAPQPYRLRVFRYRSRRLTKVWEGVTQRLYPLINEYKPPRVLPKSVDPLREFGLRWRWWGDVDARYVHLPRGFLRRLRWHARHVIGRRGK